MPQKACIGNPNGPVVEAKKLTIGDTKKSFFCSTNGCCARMLLVSGMTDHAHFRSYSIYDHKFDQCILNSLNFNSSKYSERAFNLDNAIRYIVGPAETLNIHKKRGGNTRSPKGVSIGGNQQMPIRTLKELYAQCLDTGVRGTYAGIYISDILACKHNFDRYSDGFEGFKIVEVTYYRKVYGEPALLFNYPCYSRGVHKVVRLNFQDEQTAWDYYNRFKNSNHKEPLILAGIWEKVDNAEYICECTFYKKSQIGMLTNV